jgi:NAD(P)-dependent dehydrogenase (short-subunit alcohol dehydrogenase family)
MLTQASRSWLTTARSQTQPTVGVELLQGRRLVEGRVEIPLKQVAAVGHQQRSRKHAGVASYSPLRRAASSTSRARWARSPTSRTPTRRTTSSPYRLTRTSKAALNSITIALSKALADTQVKVNAVCPGWVQTDLGGSQNRPTLP